MPVRLPQVLPVLCLLCLLCLLSACDTGDPGADPRNPFEEAEANPGQWTWVAVEGATCRDGSPTGMGVRLRENTDNLMIYLQGGGACFNGLTCNSNPRSFGESDFDALIAESAELGIFNTTRPENPVADWNAIFIPYCTGDVHAGDAPDATVEGAEGPQQFVGYRNVQRYLELLTPYFEDPGQVLLAGSSAGGFGALANYEQVTRAFDNTAVRLLNDSGPVVADDDVLTPALQARWTTLWNFDTAFPDDPLFEGEDQLENIYGYYARTYPEARFGLLSYRQDQTIRYFFAFEQPDCASPLNCISGPAYQAALEDVRDDFTPDEVWGTYYIPGDGHGLLGEQYFSTSVNGVPLTNWLETLLDGTATDVQPGAASTPARGSE